MRIGEVANEAGVNIQTIRFYERNGLLRKPRRLSSSYRDYTPETVQIVKFIKRWQQWGFKLREIKLILEGLSKAAPNAIIVRNSIEEKIRDLEEQIVTLQAMRDELSAGLNTCQCKDTETMCSGVRHLVDALKQR
ncbi:MAG TPA: MerR family transcriptional regulator [Blastocatellia bacterium]|nr:MerR family transcriptional regulator [Blastocatellia bacterium]